MSAIRVLVTGSRSYSDVDAVEWRLEELRGECTEAGGTLTVIEGGAAGADRIAGDWARRTPGVELAADGGSFDLLLVFVDRPLAKCPDAAAMVRSAVLARVPYELREPETGVPARAGTHALVTPVMERPGPRYEDDVDVRGGRL